MADEPDVELVEEPQAPETPARRAAAKEEAEFYAHAIRDDEPGVLIPLFKRGYARIPDPTGATTVALFVFLVLCALFALLALIGLAASAKEWVTDGFKIIGQALSLVVAFLVGASTSSKPTRRRK